MGNQPLANAYLHKKELNMKVEKFKKEGGKFLIHVPNVKLIWIITKNIDLKKKKDFSKISRITRA